MSRGHDRERAWVHKLREDGWWAQRAPGSLGIDVIAARPVYGFSRHYAELHFYEVKSTAAGPYSHFLPAERRALIREAEKAGAQPFLVWWPPRGKPKVIAADVWPPDSERSRMNQRDIPYGRCHCGCDEATELAPQSSTEKGWVRGEPKCYCYAHYAKSVKRSPEERFWRHVKKGEGCWEWTAVTTEGYGRFGLRKGKMVAAHRFAYELLVGAIPEGLHLDHLCRNRACVNPAHLEPVTPVENARRTRSSVCAKGHPAVETRPCGARFCRTCYNQRARERGRNRATRVLRAIERGLLERPERCSECGHENEPYVNGRTSIQAHHDDYNKPLEVRWLCVGCHAEWHRHNEPIPLQDEWPVLKEAA